MDLDQLKTLSELKYQHSLRSVSYLLAREDKLRAEIARLRTLTRETQTQPPEQERIRMIGGDVIWLQWLGKTLRKLNMELAQILAQKESLIAQHRRAHGRKMAAERLAGQEVEKQLQSKQKKLLDQIIDHSLMK
ncbi:MAG: hypothetical protein ABJR46_04470 [Tateyamaria sp.]|uniref:hypothetical protein n=1 Tax=Tateyamaria sp. TaxID=1929288 RepID=UPI00329E8A44